MAVTVERLEAEIRADPAAAIAGLNALESRLDTVSRSRRSRLDVDVDDESLTRLDERLSRVRDRSDETREGLRRLGDETREAGGAAGGAGDGVRELGNEMGSMGSAAGAGARGMSYMTRSLLTMGAQVALVISLIPQFIALLNVAAGAIFGLAGALAPVLGLLATLPAMLMGAVGGIGALTLGMGGVGAAIKAGTAAQEALGGARRSGADAARTMEIAERGLERALRGVIRAQENLAEAEKAVGEARERAAEDLEDLAQRVEDAVWNEEEAVLALQRAQRNLADAQNRTARSGMTLTQQTDEFTGKVYEVAYASQEATDSQDDLADMQRDVVRAERNLRRAQDDTKDSREQLTEAEAKGVEGSDLVLDALKRVRDAHWALKDAQDAVRDAQRQMADSAKGVGAAMGGANAAAMAFKKAMEDLTPAGRSFVTFMLNEFMPAWDKVKKAAQQALLPPIEEGMRGLLAYLPSLQVHAAAFATTVGEAIRDFMGLFTGDNAARTDALFAGANRDLNTMLDTVNLVIDAILETARVAEESGFTKWFTDAVAGFLGVMAEEVIAMAEDGRLAAWLKDVQTQASLVWDFLSNVAGILGAVTEAGKPLGNQILRDLTAITGKWLEWMGTEEGQRTMQGWFDSIGEALDIIWPLIEDIIAEFFRFGEDGSPVMEDFKEIISNIHAALPSIIRLFESMSPIIVALSAVLKPVVDFLNFLIAGLQNPLVQRLLGFGMGVVPNVAYQSAMSIQDAVGATRRSTTTTVTPPVKVSSGATWTMGTTTVTGTKGTKRAAGGQVMRGVPYVVGERRAEVFVPQVSGRIQPRVTAEHLSGGSNFTPTQLEAMVERIARRMKPDVSIENTFNEKVDPRLLSAELAWRLGQ